MITFTGNLRIGTATLITVSSDLSGTVYFHWYIDGAYVGLTTEGEKSFVLPAGDQSIIDVEDTTDPNFDPIANAPTGYSARRTLVFERSIDTDVDRYLIEQKRGAAAYVSLGFMKHDPGQWVYEFLTPRLDDLATYTWRVTPIDLAGNSGTPKVIGPELIVRTPDAPRFSATFDPGTTKVTFVSA